VRPETAIATQAAAGRERNEMPSGNRVPVATGIHNLQTPFLIGERVDQAAGGRAAHGALYQRCFGLPQCRSKSLDEVFTTRRKLKSRTVAAVRARSVISG